MTYDFVVHAYDLAGNESGPSNEVSAVPAVTGGPVLTLSGDDSPDPMVHNHLPAIKKNGPGVWFFH